jgi:cellulase (glycosyl hydrolase family 5)/Big-like domain-containing protein
MAFASFVWRATRRAAARRSLAGAAVIAALMLGAGAAPAATVSDVAAATTEGSVGVVIPLSGSGVPPLTYATASRPTHGEVRISGATAAYTPQPDFSGTDSFLYVVIDDTGVTSAPATVSITVQAIAPPAVVPPAVRISNNRLIDADGNPFEVKGLIVRPVIALFELDEMAFEHFGESELAAARQWGANTIRLLTSQPSLDPQDPAYDAQYVLSVGNAAQQVLDHGFVLIIGVNDETGSGEANRHCLPTAATERAWNTLLALPFAAPQYRDQVMFEPFNEPVAGGDPGIQPTAFWWNIWQNGGDVDPYNVGSSLTCAGERKVGMNELIGEIRAAGAKNIIIADGLSWGHFLNPLFPLTDPLRQLAYGAHPFLERWTGFHLVGKPALDDQMLDAAFGDMQTQGPVIATAVGGGAESAGTAAITHCFRDAPLVMPVLLRYLRQRHMGAVGWAFDLPPNTLTVDWNYTPTSYVGFRCPQGQLPGQGGPGQLLRQWFLATQ